MKFAFLDFEFRGVSEPKLDLVCCSVIILDEHGLRDPEEFWLFRDDMAKAQLWGYLMAAEEDGYILVAYAAEAEASSLISLGYDPLKFKWYDLFMEYRMLQNHNHRLLYGKQLIDGKIKLCHPFGEKGKQNLAAAVFKLCGKIIDTDHKEKMRNIIIYGTPEEVEANKKDIQAYCTSDVQVLPDLFDAIKKEYMRTIPRKDGYGRPGDPLTFIKQEAHWRAETSVRSAMMVRHGYPINLEWAQNLTDNIPHILRDIIEDINAQFPEIMPFKWHKRKYTRAKELKEEARYGKNETAIKAWIAKNHPDWERTETGDFSLKLEHWEAEYSFRHEFPRGNFGAQMVRYLKTEQSLKGFKDKGGSQKTTFWDHVGSDGMVRPYMNPYGAQSSRYQPGSIGFLFLKSAWQRAICQPPPGWAVGSFDFASQEVLLAAILSGDKKLYEAYCSGDVYLAYGKEIGVIPAHGTKQTHEKERDQQKPVILGWQYWITGHGLSKQLRNQTGKFWTPEDAQVLLDRLDETYSTFAEFRQRMIDMYEAYRYLKLVDGWYMWGDNRSERSVANCHPQGMGGVIARKFIQLAQDQGIRVLFPLHDASYFMFKHGDLQSMDTMAECMKKAFVHYFEGWQREWAESIRLDGKLWGPGYSDGEEVTPQGRKIKTSRLHIDKRAKSEYDKFETYFRTSPGSELL
jgi:hypothetical protein